MAKITRKKLVLASILSISAVLLLFFVFNPASAHAEKLYEVLQQTGTNQPGGIIKNVWKQLLGLINYAMIGVLIFIAFTNILRIDVSRYGIKKFLPTMILAVILANFSWTICRLMIDFANVICDALINGPTAGAGINPDKQIMGIAGSFNNFKSDYENFVTNAGTFDWAQVFRLFVLTALEFVGAVMVLILAFLFLLRNYIIYFIVSLAPLAFMAMVLPQSKKFYDQWWQNFIKWTFMPIVSLFWLWVGNKWLTPLTQNYTSFIAIAFAVATYYMAITTPFKMGGSLMSSYANWSKKAGMSLGGDLAKRKTQKWWSGQAASENKLNPLRGMARWNINKAEAIKHDQEVIGNNQAKAKAALMLNTRSGRNREQEKLHFGGDVEQAQLRVKRDYQNTTKGANWMKGRQEFLDTNRNLETEINRNFGKNQAEFTSQGKGRQLMEENTRLQQDSLRYENEVKNIQQKNMVDFLKNEGAYKHSADEKLVKDYMAATTRNMVFEEAVKKSHQDLVDKVLQDQNHMENMRQEVGLADKSIAELTTKKNRRDELQDLAISGAIGQREANELNQLNSENLDQQLTDQNTRKAEITTKAKEFYKEIQDAGYTHIDNMFDNAHNVINGFAGMAAETEDMTTLTADQAKRAKDVGKVMMTRTGKLLSIEIKGDIDKRLDEATVKEIATDISPTNNSADAHGGQSVINFRNGNRHLNTPEMNREIEARVLALGRVAKQTNNTDAPAAQEALANMLSDPAAKTAMTEVNQYIDETGKFTANRFSGNETPDEIREKMRVAMKSGQGFGKVVYNTIVNQPNVGFSKNPSGYAITADGGEFAGQYSNPQNPNQGDINFKEASKRFQAVLANAPEPSYSGLASILGGQTAQLAKNLEGLKTEMQTTRSTMAKDIADRMGLKLDQSLRPNLVKEIAKLQRTATADEVKKAVQMVSPGSSPALTNINIGEVVAQAQGMQHLEQGIKVLEQHENVNQHKPYLDHFKEMSQEQARTQNLLLQEAKKALYDTSIEKDKVIEIAKNALTKTGFAPSDKELMDDSAAIRTVVSAADSSQAAVGAFQNGTFNPDKAVDNFVSLRMNQSQPVNEPRPKPAMNDIQPPK